MLQVWGRRNSSNVMPVMWAVAELGLPHRRHDVGGSFGGVATPAFRAMNPNGRVPTIDDDGFILWESNAIVRYLCARYGAGSLAPEDPRARAIADQWMEWHKTTAYAGCIDLFWATVRTEPAMRDPARIAALAKSAGETLQVLEAQLARHPYIAGESLTMADISSAPVTHRYLQLAVERPPLPGILAWHARLMERPAFREHVAFPIGTNPAEWYMLEREGARPA